MRQRSYLNGKLNKSIAGEPATLRRYLDNIERDWSKDGLFPLTPAGEFDLNKAHSVTRVSVDELVIVNTAGRELRIVNVEK